MEENGLVAGSRRRRPRPSSDARLSRRRGRAIAEVNDDNTAASGSRRAQRRGERLARQAVDAQEAEEKYINEAVYRLGGVPEMGDQPEDGIGLEHEDIDEPSGLVDGIDNLCDQDAIEVPVGVNGGGTLLDFDRSGYGKAVLSLKIKKHRASNSLLQSMLKMTSAFFPVYHAPSSLYQVLKDLGSVNKLTYQCPSCGLDLNQKTKICPDPDCPSGGKVDHGLNIGIAELYLKPQLQRILEGKIC